MDQDTLSYYKGFTGKKCIEDLEELYGYSLYYFEE
jgi:hypothetical protein